MADPALEPMKLPDAKQLARDIAEDGVVDVSGHAVEEMNNDDLHMADCLNLIRAGVYQPPDFEKGEWRYRITTQRICIVIAFVSRTRLVVVTAWRIRR